MGQHYLSCILREMLHLPNKTLRFFPFTSGLKIELQQSFSMLMLITSCLCTSSGSKLLIICAMSSTVKEAFERCSEVLVKNSCGSLLPFLMMVYCTAKKELKSIIINNKFIFLKQWWDLRYFLIVPKAF